MRQKRDIPRPKKVFLFPEIGRVNILFHLLARIYITYMYIYIYIFIYIYVYIYIITYKQKSKQTNRQAKKEPKKQKKLKRKENISGKSIKKKIILRLPRWRFLLSPAFLETRVYFFWSNLLRWYHAYLASYHKRSF